MQIPGSKSREASRTNNSELDYNDYDWAVEPDLGWQEAVVMFTEETKTKGGDPMVKLTFGIEPQGGAAIGGRCSAWVPFTWPEKVEDFLKALLPEKADSEEDLSVNVFALRARRCGVLIAVDTDYVRRDKKTAYKIEKLAPLAEVREEIEAGGNGGENPESAEADLF